MIKPNKGLNSDLTSNQGTFTTQRFTPKPNSHHVSICILTTTYLLLDTANLIVLWLYAVWISLALGNVLAHRNTKLSPPTDIKQNLHTDWKVTGLYKTEIKDSSPFYRDKRKIITEPTKRLLHLCIYRTTWHGSGWLPMSLHEKLFESVDSDTSELRPPETWCSPSCVLAFTHFLKSI